ncbi:phosphoserine phosphatase SerB [Salinibacterium sp. NSLL150]|uniref:phosphoserine phosphatase SerB n=1 Tax=unclassified Salinibacterium TaxID=2632331 RepID=UPI0018CF24ED|nr:MULTISPECIES: phosphoserine phosphatase SerB [unclassified Salinibacterium]MBH0099135.1 phosphoserine phosphatase SerB [Salinibacterium sp. NSLL35]MBH0101889.1 phosphoserine phosphatase SerB [Salinibacterium sp. NSLL150]MBH0104649.1 phosphoserine phosphatase SerB [Salinibacterium sp. NSLL16]MBH0107409.1 phosphoserine phosphatase SerB [Salinibacterium sp. NSLL17]MBH0108814.1 phosphoserine phosphatase SerB [Salinibacterium sp. NG22]
MAQFLVVFDVDSTLIENEVIELLAARAGSEPQVTEITTRAMNGELDFEESLRARVATLAGLPESVIAECARDIRVTNGAEELIAGVKAAGGRVAAVSGGFHELLDPLAARLGLDYARANRLEVKNGLVTGAVLGPVIDAQAKADSLREWAADSDTPLSRTIAVGDGANDLLMMAAAALSIGITAKPIVRANADVHIDTRDLSAVLPLLGLRG